MKKVFILCSICILMGATLAYANVPYHSSDLFTLQSDTNFAKIRSSSDYTKLAAAHFVSENSGKRGFINFKKSFSANCQYKSTSFPDHCSVPEGSCVSEGVTYYSDACQTCNDNYILQNGRCFSECATDWGNDVYAAAVAKDEPYIDDNSDYWTTTAPQIGVAASCDIPSTNCNGGEICSKTVHAYSSCLGGFDFEAVAGGYGFCNVHDCDLQNYPYSSAPTVCKGSPVSCIQGLEAGSYEIKYGCTDCNPGYLQVHGRCDIVTCASEFNLETCPTGAKCESCQSGSQMNYKKTGCKAGYIANGDACDRDNVLAFTVTTTAANQSVTLALKGSYSVDWGDDTSETGTGTSVLDSDGNATTKDSHAHTYSEAGSYDIVVTGTPSYAAVTAGQTYITSLLDISLPSITSYHELFFGASNMTGNLGSMTFPSGLKNAKRMFTNSKISGSIPALPNSLVVGNRMFYGCQNLTGMSFSALPTSLVDGEAMFYYCRNLQGKIPTLPEGLTNVQWMFGFCDNIGANGYNFTKFPDSITNADHMFDSAFYLGYNVNGVPALPANLESAESMFYSTSINSLPELPNTLSNAKNMFSGCWTLSGTLQNLPTALTDATGMFYSSDLISGSIPQLPSGLTHASSMFAKCRNLTGTIPTLPNNLQNADRMFREASKLTGCRPRLPNSVISAVDTYFGTKTTECRDYSDSLAFTFTTESDSKTVTLAIGGSYVVNWGDGIIQGGSGGCVLDANGKPTSTDTYTHTYTGTRPYDIVVTGTPTYVAVTSGAANITNLWDISLPSITSYYATFKGATEMEGTLTDMSFPSGLITGYETFKNCSKLTGTIPTLPTGLTNGHSMFYNCSGLTGEIPDLPSGITDGVYMFYKCSNLTGEIPALPSSLADGRYMFQKSTKLSSLGFTELPNGITKTDSMFNGCTNLVGCRFRLPDSVTSSLNMYTDSKIKLCEPANSFMVKEESYNKQLSYYIAGPYTIDWGDGTVESGTGTSVIDADGVPTTQNAITHTYSADGLYEVTITGSPTWISPCGRYFYSVAGEEIMDISLPSIVSYYHTFKGGNCGDISNMRFPPNLKNASYMFGTLTACDITGSIPEFPETLTIADHMFYGCKDISGTIPDLPENLTSVYDMFYKCYGLTGCYPKVSSSFTPSQIFDLFARTGTHSCYTHPDNSFAFKVTMPSNGKIGITLRSGGDYYYIDWGDGKLSSNSSYFDTTASYTYSKAGVYEIHISGAPTLLKVSSGQSYITELLDISLPSVTTYTDAFKNATNMTGNLSNMSFPSGLQYASNMFYNCPNLTGTPTLPNTLINGSYMFYGCTGLSGNAPALPTSMTNGSYMFYNDTGLTGNVPTLPTGLTDGSYMFYGCTGLSGNVPALPSNFWKGSYMFYGCTGLSGDISSLVLPQEMEYGNYMFYNDAGLTGTCPTRPAYLSTYTNMYTGTGVSCSYGM